ncbi:NAD-dependent epimerase/dehydratase family protein [Ectothiorhodospira mobilis]|uniref:NAD-dependent epimerase/dehydratase family protein n=1 Tax=Ectothiorhodospira mobilis TaxID=195064 RepID=UPI001EE8522C|nr:NAD-dependent epimerase/dehydratase family protein [Ectothiorhodospira mobilis]MCG5534477.1 NAD(P)H-binding protein [Ectothiorhodospira mobilis]
MNIRTVCVLGGTGFVGRHLVKALSAAGLQVKVFTRRVQRARPLLVLPGVVLVETDYGNVTDLQHAFEGSDAIIHLVGIPDGHAKLQRRVHVDLPRTVVEAARLARVQRLVYMSALHADAHGGASTFLRTKGAGEDLVHAMAEEVRVTSFRPAPIFGRGDALLTPLAARIQERRRLLLANAGARLAPVYVMDVVERLVQALFSPHRGGDRHDLCGPRTYTLGELAAYMAHTLNRPCRILPLPDALAAPRAWLAGRLPGGHTGLDRHRTLQVGAQCPAGDPCPTPLEAVVADVLVPSDLQGRLQQLRSRPH